MIDNRKSLHKHRAPTLLFMIDYVNCEQLSINILYSSSIKKDLYITMYMSGFENSKDFRFQNLKDFT